MIVNIELLSKWTVLVKKVFLTKEEAIANSVGKDEKHA